MRVVSLIGLWMCAAIAHASGPAGATDGKRDVRSVEGRVFLTRATHCGGVAPSRDEPLSERHAAAAQKLLVRRGHSNHRTTPVTEVTADAAGHFTLQLEPGSYCVVQESKRSPTHSDGPDTPQDCLDQAFAHCDAKLTVAADAPTPAITVELDMPCIGVCYRGSLPP